MKNKPIRIAQIVGKVLCGVDTLVMEYYRNIDRNKIQFDFFMDGQNETLLDNEILDLGGRVYKVEPYAQDVRKNMKQYYTIFQENRYPIVHSHLNTLSVFPLYEAWRAKVPVRIAHNHSTAAIGEGKKTMIKYMLRPSAKIFATHYCACSESAGKWLFGDSCYRSGKVRLVKNAIDVDKFRFNEQVRKRIRQDFNIEDRFVMGHVGRFVYQKNHDFLIDIFNQVYQRNQNAILILIGSGDLQQDIAQKIANLGLTNAVLLLGMRKDVHELMQAMDILVFPSFYEGLGVVTIEAQAAGLRTIVSEAVPKEAKITDLLEYCRLSQPASDWADCVLANNGARRFEQCNKNGSNIRQAGYDIGTASKELGEWYEKLKLELVTR